MKAAKRNKGRVRSFVAKRVGRSLITLTPSGVVVNKQVPERWDAESPKATRRAAEGGERGRGLGRGMCPLPNGERSGEGLCPSPEKFKKM